MGQNTVNTPGNAGNPLTQVVSTVHKDKCATVCTLWRKGKSGGCRQAETAWMSGRDPDRCIRSAEELNEAYRRIKR